MSENLLQEYYYKVEMPKVRQKISEFKTEMGNQGKCMRLSYLYDQLFELDLELIERQRAYKRSIEQDQPYVERAFIASFIPDIEKEVERIERGINFIVRGSEKANKGVTEEMIQQAREYPIENLIEVKRGTTLCPFHNDHNPSMGIKNNHYHCFACGAKGDVLDFVMKRDSLSFTEAIKWLNQN